MTDFLSLCDFQGRLFEKSISLSNFSSPVFIKLFMNSNIAYKIDTGSYFSDTTTIENIIQELNLKNTPSNKNNIFHSQQMYWIGYTYRYWNLSLSILSKNIFKIANGNNMNSVYLAYHTLDCSKAIERIYQAKGINLQKPNLLNSLKEQLNKQQKK